MRSILAASLVLLGCSTSTSGAPSGSSDADAFVGTWARSGMTTLTCPGGTPAVTAVTGNLVITLGSTSGTIVSTSPEGCMGFFTVSGNLATAMTFVPCTIAGDATFDGVLTGTSHTLTLSSSGESLTEAFTGTLVKGSGGTMETCNETATGTFTKS
jgi:hypothetical protein